MKPRYRVTLREEERQQLDALKRGKTSAKRFLYARALLLCDAGPQGPAWTVADVAEAMGVTPRTIEHLKQRFVEDGLAAALERKQPEKPPRAENAYALICGPPIMIKFTLPVLSDLGFPPDRIITSLEMGMKCGVGICGRCNIGTEYVCRDGPVFTLEQLAGLPAEY